VLAGDTTTVLKEISDAVRDGLEGHGNYEQFIVESAAQRRHQKQIE
jgi:hypothetical protein